MRLNAYLAQAGVAARRKADQLIKAGRVSVNGQPAQLNDQIRGGDVVKVDGAVVAAGERHYIVLNKPVGYVTTMKDERRRPVVTDLISIADRVVPVGRLDLNTSGLLILTNDGQLANRLMHPSFKVDKTYLIETDKNVTPQILNKLSNGLELDGRLTAPAKVKKLAPRSIVLTIHEGRKRQIRRMLEQLGLKVVRLHRIQYAGLELGSLKPGQWRHLSAKEAEQLKSAITMLK